MRNVVPAEKAGAFPDYPKRVRILAAFGDISGFGVYSNRVDDESTQSIPFFYHYDKLVADLRRELGCYFDDTGDGFIAIMEISEDRASEKAIKLLVAISQFYVRIQSFLKKWPSPKPTGYRIRAACGHALKSPGYMGPIYRSKNINLAHEMLAVEKEIPILCHESVKQLISSGQAKRAGLKFTGIRNGLPMMDGIYANEQEYLWQVSYEKPKKRSLA